MTSFNSIMGSIAKDFEQIAQDLEELAEVAESTPIRWRLARIAAEARGRKPKVEHAERLARGIQVSSTPLKDFDLVVALRTTEGGMIVDAVLGMVSEAAGETVEIVILGYVALGDLTVMEKKIDVYRREVKFGNYTKSDLVIKLADADRMAAILSGGLTALRQAVINGTVEDTRPIT